MKVLALDTTAQPGSVAFFDDVGIVDERLGDETRTHAERLPREIISLLAAHRLTLRDVDLFAVASGPGSFTGLRIGIATIQGLAFATGRPAIGVGALDALAHIGSRDLPRGARIATWMDARRREVFAAVYEVGAGAVFAPGRVVQIEEAVASAPDTLLMKRESRADVFIGDAATLYRDVIVRADPQAKVEAAGPLAGAIAAIAVERARRGETVNPGGLHPVYVRRPDAVLAREAERSRS